MEELKGELESLGIVIKQESFLEKLWEVGQRHELSAEDLANEWFSFSFSNNECQLSIPNIERFTSQMRLRKKAHQTPSRNSTSRSQTTPTQRHSDIVYTKESLHLLFNTNIKEEDDDPTDLMSAYGGQPSKQTRGTKRSVNSAVTPVSKLRHIPKTPNPDSQSPNDSITETPATKYDLRQNRGKVICSYNESVLDKWVESASIVQVDIFNAESAFTRVSRHMYQIPSQKRMVLVNHLEELGRKICEFNKLPDLSNSSSLATATTEPSIFVGRVACEGEGRINPSSCILEGVESFQISLRHRLARVMLHIPDTLPPCSLFPGQVVVVEGTLDHSLILTPTKIYDEGSVPLSPSREAGMKIGGLSGILAAGPFTVTDNLHMTPLYDLLSIVSNEKPHILLLLGPFIDIGHSAIKDQSFHTSFEVFFVKEILKPIFDECQKSNTRVVVVPSQKDICHPWVVFPQPPFSFTDDNLSNVVTFVSDPATLVINGVVIGISSTDILFHLSSRTMFIGSNGDRMTRLVSHILHQQSYYPLYPPFVREEMVTKATDIKSSSTPYLEHLPEVNLDLLLAYDEGHALLPVKPDILVLPSDLKPFVKVIDDCVCINPGHITKKAGGGTFTRFTIPEIIAPGDISVGIQTVHI